MTKFTLMGVSGCGKSTVGRAAAAACGMEFFDGDDLHPETNVEKMSRGEPLDDNDREPWLVAVGQALAKDEKPRVVGCSALKKKYRDIIRREAGAQVHFIHLDASFDVLNARVSERKGHFMPASLLQSQFDALQPLGEDELGVAVDIARPLDAVVQDAERYIRENS